MAAGTDLAWDRAGRGAELPFRPPSMLRGARGALSSRPAPSAAGARASAHPHPPRRRLPRPRARATCRTGPSCRLLEDTPPLSLPPLRRATVRPLDSSSAHGSETERSPRPVRIGTPPTSLCVRGTSVRSRESREIRNLQCSPISSARRPVPVLQRRWCAVARPAPASAHFVRSRPSSLASTAGRAPPDPLTGADP